MAAANSEARDLIAARLEGAGLRHRIGMNSNAAFLRASDLALCASGTATLEVAYHGVPMVVMYNGSKWGYRLVGRFLVNTPHLSLPNILAGRRIVPEFMPYFTSTEPIAREALDILAHAEKAASIRTDLQSVISSLGSLSAAGRTAMIAVEMVGAGERGGACRAASSNNTA